MAWVIGGAIVLSAGVSYFGGKEAASAADRGGRRAEATQREAIAEDKRQFNLLQEQERPFREMRLSSLQEMDRLSKDPGAFQDDPLFGFLQEQGQKSVETSAAARGRGLSGGALKELQRVGTQIASGYRSSRLNEFATMAGLSPMGGQAAAAGGRVSSGMSGLAGLQMSRGNTQAAGIMGQTQNIQNMLNLGLSAYQGTQRTNALNNLGAGN